MLRVDGTATGPIETLREPGRYWVRCESVLSASRATGVGQGIGYSVWRITRGTHETRDRWITTLRVPEIRVGWEGWLDVPEGAAL